MAEATMDNRTLMRRTLITVGAMVGACVVLVGTVTLLAAVIVGHAVAPPGDAENAGTGGAVPVANVHGGLPGTKPPPPGPLAK
jgi:hypothetical protein